MIARRDERVVSIPVSSEDISFVSRPAPHLAALPLCIQLSLKPATLDIISDKLLMWHDIVSIGQ